MIKGSARDDWGRFSSVSHGVVPVARVCGAGICITFESPTCVSDTRRILPSCRIPMCILHKAVLAAKTVKMYESDILDTMDSCDGGVHYFGPEKQFAKRIGYKKPMTDLGWVVRVFLNPVRGNMQSRNMSCCVDQRVANLVMKRTLVDPPLRNQRCKHIPCNL
jgi:hypothetical protein